MGVGIYGNDHYLTNVIVYSALIGVELTGAANILSGVHTWNCATGNGGIGILNAMSQNRFEGCYLDFTDMKLTNAQQVSKGQLSPKRLLGLAYHTCASSVCHAPQHQIHIPYPSSAPTASSLPRPLPQVTVINGFYLGGAQLVLAAPGPKSAVAATTIASNVWYDTNSAAIVANETLGTWTAITDLQITGSTQSGVPNGVVTATKVFTVPANTPYGSVTIDFSDVLLFPSAPIVTARADVVGTPTTVDGGLQIISVLTQPITATDPQKVTLYWSAPPTGVPGGPGAATQVAVSVDQSAHSNVFAYTPPAGAWGL